MKKILIFDTDGVLIDSEPIHAIARDKVLKTLNINVEENTNLAIGRSKPVFYQMMIDKYLLPYTAEELSKLEFEKIIEIMRDMNIKAMRGVNEILKYLKNKGIIIGLASSSFKNYITNILQITQIEKYFDYIVCGDEISKPKPAPDIYLKILEKVGIEAKDAFAIEDSTTGIKSATLAGIKCFGYNDKEIKSTQNFSLCYKIIGDLIEIKDYI